MCADAPHAPQPSFSCCEQLCVWPGAAHTQAGVGQVSLEDYVHNLRMQYGIKAAPHPTPPLAPLPLPPPPHLLSSPPHSPPLARQQHALAPHPHPRPLLLPAGHWQAARKPPASKKQQQAVQPDGGGLMNSEPEVYAEAFSIDKCINLYVSIFRWLGKPLGGGR